ncbi:flippase [Sodalis sp. dw_96]|uniref:flippase n=1 Tax=Sodalis sp. dw_96 TaxID=2719794 RepID=UPI001BD53CAF|nr:flippase [Sodalis sp. dw_96]
MKEIIFNSLWVILEKSCFAIAGIISAMYVARYLGPENFGTLSYLLSIMALVTPFIQLGSDNVLFNRIAKKPASGIALMAASQRLKLVLYIVFSIGLLLWAKHTLPLEQQKVMIVLIVANFFTLQDIYKLYYDATLASKTNLIINNVSLIIFVCINLAWVHYQFSLIWFAFSIVVRSFVPYLWRRILFNRTQQKARGVLKKQLKFKYFDFYNMYLLKVGMPLLISSLSIVIYTRIDQILLGKFLGFGAVGIYNAATTISQGWVIVPMALITSYMTVIAAERDSGRSIERVRSLYLIIMLISLPVVLIFSLFSNKIIYLVYGIRFADAADILWICALTSLCSVLGTLSYRVILLNSGYHFVSIKMAVIALLNVGLNYFFIPQYGIKGAALSTLTAEMVSLIFLNALFKKGLVTYPLFCAYKSVPLLINEVRSYVKSAR